MPRKKAKGQRVNKSQLVRDYRRADRKATAKEVAAALKKQGAAITAAHISNTKGQAKKKRKPTGKAKAVPKSARSSTSIDLERTLDLIAQLGGLQHIEAVVDLLKNIKAQLAVAAGRSMVVGTTYTGYAGQANLYDRSEGAANPAEWE